jgi:hypothetical protein
MIVKRALCGLICAGVLSACGSGSGQPLSPAPAASKAALARVAVSIRIPRPKTASARRAPAFVSPSTNGVAVKVTHLTGGVVDYDVTTNYDVAPASSSTCAGTDPEVCMLEIPAPVAESPDFDSFDVTLYDQAPGGAANTFGSGAKVLGSGSSTASITANAANSIVTYIDGLPESVAFFENGVTQSLLSGDGYLGFTASIGVEPMDVDLNVITGGTYDPYASPFAISVTEPETPAGSTTLAISPPDLSGASPPAPVCNAAATGVKSVTTCRTSDAISATYLQPASATFDESYFALVSSGTTAVPATAPVYIAPIFVADSTDPATSSSGPSFTQGASGTSPLLALGGGKGTVSPREPGAVSEGSSPSFTPSQNAGCNGVIAPGGIVAKSNGSFSIQGVSLGSASDNGTCVVTFTDAAGGTVALAVSDT